MPEARAKRKAAKKKTARSKRKAAPGLLTIVQVRSGICCNKRHKSVLRALGLRHPHHVVKRPDNPAVRGMVDTIPHLARIVEG